MFYAKSGHFSNACIVFCQLCDDGVAYTTAATFRTHFQVKHRGINMAQYRKKSPTSILKKTLAKLKRVKLKKDHRDIRIYN